MNERYTVKNNNGILSIGGVNCTDLVNTYGTPLYVFDEKRILDMIDVFTKTLKKEYGEGTISYASKVFCCKEIYRIIDTYDMTADVVSIGELKTALSVGFSAKKLYFHGNNKTFSELKTAIESGVGTIIIDSVTEIDDIDNIAKEKGIVQDVLLRVNPGVEAHTHHYIQTAKADSKFGFSVADENTFDVISKIISKKNLSLKGLHCHIGSQIFEIQSFLITVEKMSDFYLQVKNRLNFEFDTLDLGGGFGIWYTEGDREFSLQDYSCFIKEILSKITTEFDKKNLKKPFVIFEPGRSIVGEAGITLYTAGRIKEIKDIKNYISIDGGMFENPRFALYQARYTVLNATRLNEKPLKKYTIAGKCCESGDIIAEDCILPETKEGDILAVLSTGAYNYSMASNYNRNLVPPVVFVKDGFSRLVVKGQTFDNILQNDL